MVNKQKQAGFTLVELMVVIVILGVLLTMGPPAMSKVMERTRNQATAEDIYSSLMVARSEALKRNQAVSICKKNAAGTACNSSVEWDAGWIIYSDLDNDNVPDADEIIRVTDAFAGGQTIRLAGATFSNQITYATDGSASGAGTFVVCGASEETESAKEVIVEITGRPRLTSQTADCTP